MIGRTIHEQIIVLVETPCVSKKKLLRLKIWFYITESHLNTSYKIGGCLCGRRKGVKEICPDNKSRFAPKTISQQQFIKNDYWKTERQTDYALIAEMHLIGMVFGALSATKRITRKAKKIENGTERMAFALDAERTLFAAPRMCVLNVLRMNTK